MFNVCPNNVGRGKGLVIYYREEKATARNIYTDENLQLSVVSNQAVEIIGFYRSAGDKNFISAVENLIQPSKFYLLIGDLNICSKSYSHHAVFKDLSRLGFKLITEQSTHILGGYLDQAWIKLVNVDSVQFHHSLYSPVYNCMDHDAILISIKNNVPDETIGKYPIKIFPKFLLLF